MVWQLKETHIIRFVFFLFTGLPLLLLCLTQHAVASLFLTMPQSQTARLDQHYSSKTNSINHCFVTKPAYDSYALELPNQFKYVVLAFQDHLNNLDYAQLFEANFNRLSSDTCFYRFLMGADLLSLSCANDIPSSPFGLITVKSKDRSTRSDTLLYLNGGTTGFFWSSAEGEILQQQQEWKVFFGRADRELPGSIDYKSAKVPLPLTHLLLDTTRQNLYAFSISAQYIYYHYCSFMGEFAQHYMELLVFHLRVLNHQLPEVLGDDITILHGELPEQFHIMVAPDTDEYDYQDPDYRVFLQDVAGNWGQKGKAPKVTLLCHNEKKDELLNAQGKIIRRKYLTPALDDDRTCCCFTYSSSEKSKKTPKLNVKGRQRSILFTVEASGSVQDHLTGIEVPRISADSSFVQKMSLMANSWKSEITQCVGSEECFNDLTLSQWESMTQKWKQGYHQPEATIFADCIQYVKGINHACFKAKYAEQLRPYTSLLNWVLKTPEASDLNKIMSTGTLESNTYAVVVPAATSATALIPVSVAPVPPPPMTTPFMAERAIQMEIYQKPTPPTSVASASSSPTDTGLTAEQVIDLDIYQQPPPTRSELNPLIPVAAAFPPLMTTPLTAARAIEMDTYQQPKSSMTMTMTTPMTVETAIEMGVYQQPPHRSQPNTGGRSSTMPLYMQRGATDISAENPVYSVALPPQ